MNKNNTNNQNTMKTIIAVGTGAVKGYKKAGIPGAIVGGAIGFLTSKVK